MLQNDKAEWLSEGLDPEEKEELGNLERAASRLSAWQVPVPTDAERSAFINGLASRLPAYKQTHPRAHPWLDMVLSQVGLFAPEFWYACGAILFITLAGGIWVGKGALSLFTIIMTPLLVTAGVLYAFRSDSTALTRLELASPIDPFALFFCRSGLILAVNLLIIPLLLLPGEILFPELVFWRVLVIWLGALMGTYGLAIYTSLRWNGILKIVLPLGVWGLLVIGTWQYAVAAAGTTTLPMDWLIHAVSTSNMMVVAAGLVFAAGTFLFVQSIFWIRKGNRRWA
jgi:hypothetical protein